MQEREHDFTSPRPPQQLGQERSFQLPLFSPPPGEPYNVIEETVPARTVTGEVVPQTKQFVVPAGISLPPEFIPDEKTPFVPSHVTRHTVRRGEYYDQPRHIPPKR